jgi:hypothetical protein
MGLGALLLPVADLQRLRWVARWRNDPPGRAVAFTAQRLVWDGKTFKVELKAGKLEAKEKEAAL